MDSLAEKTDEAIAARVQEGDIESFGVLVLHYEPKTTRCARKFLLGGEDGKPIRAVPGFGEIKKVRADFSTHTH